MYSGLKMLETIITEITCFFLSGFSFTNIYDSEQEKREATSLTPL